jgi:hypothetical protein
MPCWILFCIYTPRVVDLQDTTNSFTYCMPCWILFYIYTPRVVDLQDTIIMFIKSSDRASTMAYKSFLSLSLTDKVVPKGLHQPESMLFVSLQ